MTPVESLAICSNLMSAYVEQASSTPESIAETGAGDCEWASGSQVCMGARPALVPYPIKTNMNESLMIVRSANLPAETSVE
ncbi:MAG: hypothetical protein ACD_47C00103G0001 [uncultured bacterium]|nr:MAG: hypothetical protein ACD_47C00103G0001 [uncultured bacterium]